MTSLPLTLVGVLLALLLFGSTLNMFSIIGFIMLMGLVTKNAILLVDFANQARRGARCSGHRPSDDPHRRVAGSGTREVAANPDDHARDDLRHAAARAGPG